MLNQWGNLGLCVEGILNYKLRLENKRNEYIALGDSCVLSLRGNSTLEMVKDATLYCSKLVLAPAGNDAATLTVRRQLDSFQQFYSIICCEKENELNQTAVRKGEDGLYEVTWTVQPRIER